MKPAVLRTERLVVGGKAITIYRKQIKTLRLVIDKHTAEIRVNAPLRLSLAKIETFIQGHLDWIEKNQNAILLRTNQVKDLKNLQAIPVFGRQYALALNQAKRRRYSIDHETQELVLFTRDFTNEEIQDAINELYRAELNSILDQLQATCEGITKKKIAHIQLRRMKTLLGSCKPSEKKITLNTQLAKYPIECIQMVLLHEIAHFTELSHNDKFKRVLTNYCPEWRELRKKMKRV